MSLNGDPKVEGSGGSGVAECATVVAGTTVIFLNMLRAPPHCILCFGHAGQVSGTLPTASRLTTPRVKKRQLRMMLLPPARPVVQEELEEIIADVEDSNTKDPLITKAEELSLSITPKVHVTEDVAQTRQRNRQEACVSAMTHVAIACPALHR